MKRVIYLSALAALLLGTASCATDQLDDLSQAGEVQVSFTATLGDGIDSRAISDGTKADKLMFFVYENGQEIPALRQTSVPVAGKQATVTTRLVKGHTYSFVFWAQHTGSGFWGLSLTADGPTVTMRDGSSRNPITANDDNADAFCNVLPDYEVTASFTEDVTLYRPFAQINILANDAASVTDFENYTSAINGWTGDVQCPSTLNLLTGATSGSTMAPILNAALPDEPLPGYEQYKLVATRYVLAPAEQLMVSAFNFDLAYGTQHSGTTIENVPVRRNYRTNIIGNWFTEATNYFVQINPMYEGESTNPAAIPAGEVAQAVTVPGATVVVEPRSRFSLDMSTIAEGVTLDANGSTIVMTADMTAAQRTVSKNNVTLKNLFLSNDGSFSKDLYPLRVNAANFTLKNATLIDSYAGLFVSGTSPDGVILFEDCNFGRYEFSQHGITPFKCLVIYGTSTVRINRCTLEGTYPFNCDGSSCDMIVENSTLAGWTSYNCGDGHTATFTGCKFARGFGDVYGQGYAYLRAYNNTTLTNCEFSPDFMINVVNGVTIHANGCTWQGGAPLDGSVCDPDSWNGEAYIDGVKVNI